jgi:anaphase-promoting complex subunit 6
MGSATEDADRTRRIAAAAAASVQQLGSRAGMADVMRAKADSYSRLGVHITARFLADKAVAATPSGNPEDILRLARVHALAGQHRRALHLLTSSNIGESSLVARLLSAQCFFAVGDFEDCLAILGDSENEPPCAFENAENVSAVQGCQKLTGSKLFSEQTPTGLHRPTSQALSAYADTPEIRAALCLMRAKVFEELENFERAALWYKRALVWDVYCYEAFMCLTEAGLITVDDARQFVEDLQNIGLPGNSNRKDVDSSDVNSMWLASDSLDGSSGSGGRGSRPRPLAPQQTTMATSPSEACVWMCAFYRAQVDRSGPLPLGSVRPETSEKKDVDVALNMRNASSRPLEFVLSEPRMRNNIDVMALRACRLFDILNFEECVRVTRSILSRDPFVDKRVMLVHLAALVELDERHELFVIAHTLVEKSPREACSWLAVGYYYFSCSKFELARRYLQKATSLYARLGPAWLAIGHAFASQDESDHAMAAYRTASRLLPNAPLPPLFMGMEYVRQSSLTHASSFFQIAREACPTDPAPRHELGVVAYRTGDLRGAVAFFKAALSLWETGDCAEAIMPSGGRRAEAEETTIFNLGHCYRRLCEFDRAKRCYERALGLRPRSTSTCCALGMTLHAMGDHSGAVAMYHRALRYSPEDTMSSLLLERALEDLCSEPSCT